MRDQLLTLVDARSPRNEAPNQRFSLANATGRSLSQYERTNEAGFVRIGLSYQRREVANASASAPSCTPFHQTRRVLAFALEIATAHGHREHLVLETL